MCQAVRGANRSPSSRTSAARTSVGVIDCNGRCPKAGRIQFRSWLS